MAEDRNRKTALSLMRMALALLDKADEVDAACHLQRAIDAATRQTAMSRGEELDPALVDRHVPLKGATDQGQPNPSGAIGAKSQRS